MSRRFTLNTITTILLLTTSTTNFADDLDMSDISLQDLFNIEVTSASKIATQSSHAPAVITAYKQATLKQYGYEVINDLLYSLPSFGPSQDYDRPTVATRGNFDSWSNNHILHLIDGIPMNDNLYGTAYTWFTPTFTSKSIEVIRGPGSALYGSNATNGVVQMNTFNGADLEKSLSLKSSIIANNGTKQIELLTGNDFDQWDLILGYNYHSTDGSEYQTYDGSNRLATLEDPTTGRPRSQSFLRDDSKKDSYLWAKASYKHEWQLQYHRQDWSFGTGHGWVFWLPDQQETMEESRDILALKHNSNINENLMQEYVIRYQKHNILWHQRYYPDNAFAGFYPSGMWEVLDTSASDIFIRAQLTWLLQDKATMLFGFEGDRFSYSGDNIHTSNIDVDITLAPFEGNQNQNLGPWLDYIADKPVINTAFYAQLTSGEWFNNLEATVGVRYDNLSVDYKEVYSAGQPQKEKSWDKISPRIALVWSLDNDIVLKAMWGKAFRAPTPTEMGGAHTFSLASNIAELQPELLTSSELMLNWQYAGNRVLRANYFITEFDNQIAYSTVNFNLSTNIYSTKNSGFELEWVANEGNWNSFANLSYAKRDNETILAYDANGIPEFAQHPNELKWEPKLKLNAGVSYQWEKFNVALSLHYHGKVERRNNELGNPNGWLPLGVDVPANYNLDDHRPQQIDSWITLDSKISYQVSEKITVDLTAKNLTDKRARLIKTGPFPFDYQIPQRQLKLSVEFKI